MRIKTKVDKAKGKEISDLNLKGVVVDEDIQRIYPFNNLASHVIGFVGRIIKVSLVLRLSMNNI